MAQALNGNVNMIWWAFPIAEMISLGISNFFLVRIYRNIIQHIGKGLEAEK